MENPSKGFVSHFSDDLFCAELIAVIEREKDYARRDQFTGKKDIFGKLEAAITTQGKLDALDGIINLINTYKDLAGQA